MSDPGEVQNSSAAALFLSEGRCSPLRCFQGDVRVAVVVEGVHDVVVAREAVGPVPHSVPPRVYM